MSDDGPDDPTLGYQVVATDPLAAAEENAADKIQPFIDPPLAESPVVPLGFLGGKVVFAMPEGEIRMELASKVSGMLRTDIYACARGQQFLAYWRNKKDEFLREMATVWFVRKCREAGLWDGGRAVRSLGVWPGLAGELVLHLGDQVWRLEGSADKGAKKPEIRSVIEMLRPAEGQKPAPGSARGALYRLRPPAPRPGKALSLSEGQAIRDALDLWRFEAIGDEGLTGADVAAGWLAAAMLGAFAPFRGHLMVNAAPGAGKTTLARFIHALQSALAGEIIDSFSEAGLRGDLAGMARPVLLDEAESGSGVHGPGVVERALDLVRRMATGTGGHRVMGSMDGGSVSQTAVGAVFMAAVNPPKLGPADATRFVEVRLRPLLSAEAARPASHAEVEAQIVKARELAPRLLGRVLRGAWRYLADVAAVSSALLRAGESPRTADLIAMLAAGRRMLLFDEALSGEDADGEVAFWRPLMTARKAAESVSNAGEDALAHLMAADSGVHVRDRRTSLGELVARWLKDREDYDEPLKAHGLRLYSGKGPDGRDGPWLFVANNHPKLDAIFKGTRWGDWRKTLEYIRELGPDFEIWRTTPQYFGVGNKQRALAIPLTPWVQQRPGVVGTGERSEPVPGGVPSYDFE